MDFINSNHLYQFHQSQENQKLENRFLGQFLMRREFGLYGLNNHMDLIITWQIIIENNVDRIMEKFCFPTTSNLVLKSSSWVRTGKTNNAASAVVWWRCHASVHWKGFALCHSLTESAVSWYKRQLGGGGDVCLETDFHQVQFSIDGHTRYSFL